MIIYSTQICNSIAFQSFTDDKLHNSISIQPRFDYFISLAMGCGFWKYLRWHIQGGFILSVNVYANGLQPMFANI